MCSEIYSSASPLYMFRTAHTPIIRSTILTVSTAIGTIHSRSQIVSVTSSQRSLARTKTSLHIVTSVGYSIEYYDARNNKYKVLSKYQHRVSSGSFMPNNSLPLHYECHCFVDSKVTSYILKFTNLIQTT